VSVRKDSLLDTAMFAGYVMFEFEQVTMRQNSWPRYQQMDGWTNEDWENARSNLAKLLVVAHAADEFATMTKASAMIKVREMQNG
jgi:hypothetical protein